MAKADIALCSPWAAAVGFALQAAALGLGSVLLVPALLVSSLLLGIVVLGETLKTNDAGWFALGLAIVAVAVATVALACGAALATRVTADAKAA